MNPRKPDTRQAMQNLLEEINRRLPLYAPEASLCRKDCVGCPRKLIQYMENEYETWRMALQDGETPSFGELNKLARSARKIYAVFVKNGLARNNS